MAIPVRFPLAWRVWIISLLATAALPSLAGQTVPQVEAGSVSAAGRGGLQLFNVTGWVGSYSTAIPSADSRLRLPSDIALGTSATLGWTRTRARGNVSFAYTSSFIGRVRFTGAQALNHALSLFASRRITPRWSLEFSLSGALSTIDQLLFTPSSSGRLAEAPADFEELAAAMLRGQISDPQLAALLTGSLLDSSARVTVFGDRNLSASSQIRLAYTPSARTSFHVALGGSRNQVLPQTESEFSRPRGVLTHSTAADLSVGFNHALTLRTTVGLSASRSRVFSALQQSYRDSFYGTLGRKMGRRWLAQAYGGAGRIQPIRTLYPLPSGPQYLAGGSVAFKMNSHTLLASADRNFGDSYGLGGQSMLSVNGAWNWSPRGRNWGLSASLGQSRMLGSWAGALNSWRAAAGCSRRLNMRTAVYTEYAYIRSSIAWGAIPNFSQHAARVAVVWSPRWSPLR